MPHPNAAIRNRKSPKNPKARCLFILQQDLLDQIREVADENEISVSAFLRESARRNLSAYRSQKAALHL